MAVQSEDDEAAAINTAVRLLAMRHRARAASLLATIGLNIGQEVLLFELAIRDGRTQAQLATAASCEAPTVTMAVRKLEAAGLISRVRSEHDNRAVLVSLTDAGHELMPRLRAIWRQLALETAGELPRADRKRLVHLLQAATASLDGPAQVDVLASPIATAP